MKIDDNVQGIFYAISSSFWICITFVFVRYLSNEFHPLYLIFWRSLFSFLILYSLVIFIPKYRYNIFKTDNLKLYISRAIISFISMSLWFYILANMELPFATALSFIAPIFSTIAAIIFLKEKVSYRRWSAIVVGFIGVLIIIRPGYREFDYLIPLTLFCTALWGVVSVMLKKLSNKDNSVTVTIYMSLFMLPMSLPFLFIYYQSISYLNFFLIFLMSLSATIAHIFLAKSLEKTEITVIMPFDFFRLIFISILAYIFFAETIDIYEIIGAAIIVSSSVYVTHREQKLAKSKKS